MVLSELVTFINDFTVEFGAQTSLNVKTVIGMRMREWVKRTECLFSNKIAFASGSAVGPYPYGGAFFEIDSEAVQLVRPLYVWLNDRLIEDMGFVNAVELTKYATLATAAAASTIPAGWYRTSENSFDFLPQLPASAQTGVIAGVYHHAAIDSGSDDDLVITLPDEMIIDFARFVAEIMIEPLAKGDQVEALDRIRAVNGKKLEYWRRDGNEMPTLTTPLRMPDVVRF